MKRKSNSSAKVIIIFIYMYSLFDSECLYCYASSIIMKELLSKSGYAKENASCTLEAMDG